MKIKHFPSTDLKLKTAEILNMVAYGNITAIVERHGKPLVEIRPVKKRRKEESIKETEKKVRKYFGAIPGFPDVTKYRHSRRRKVNL